MLAEGVDPKRTPDDIEIDEGGGEGTGGGARGTREGPTRASRMKAPFRRRPPSPAARQRARAAELETAKRSLNTAFWVGRDGGARWTTCGRRREPRGGDERGGGVPLPYKFAYARATTCRLRRARAPGWLQEPGAAVRGAHERAAALLEELGGDEGAKPRGQGRRREAAPPRRRLGRPAARPPRRRRRPRTRRALRTRSRVWSAATRRPREIRRSPGCDASVVWSSECSYRDPAWRVLTATRSRRSCHPHGRLLGFAPSRVQLLMSPTSFSFSPSEPTRRSASLFLASDSVCPRREESNVRPARSRRPPGDGGGEGLAAFFQARAALELFLEFLLRAPRAATGDGGVERALGFPRVRLGRARVASRRHREERVSSGDVVRDAARRRRAKRSGFVSFPLLLRRRLRRHRTARRGVRFGDLVRGNFRPDSDSRRLPIRTPAYMPTSALYLRPTRRRSPSPSRRVRVCAKIGSCRPRFGHERASTGGFACGIVVRIDDGRLGAPERARWLRRRL